METLALLRRKASDVSFDVARVCFVRSNGTTCKGLLPVLARAFPLENHSDDGCPRCGTPKKTVSQASKTAKNAGYAARTGQFASKKRKKSGHFIAIPASECADDLPVSPYVPPKKCLGFTAMMHGTAIDRDIVESIRLAEYRPMDPCSAKLLHFIRSVRGWIPVAAQLPIQVRTLGVATAIDLLCTDAATKTKLILVEIKSTWSHAGTPALIDACYRHSTERTVANLPLSRYLQNQLQLWAMEYALRQEYGIAVHQAVVIRVGPTFVAEYPLNNRLRACEVHLLAKIRDSSVSS